MAYDVASSINELLFEKNSVIVPGFGGFELQQQPANIDHIKSAAGTYLDYVRMTLGQYPSS